MNTADFLLEKSADEDTALITGKGRFTYEDLRYACVQIAGELIRHGIHPGDRVGILGQNSLFWVASYLATLKLYAIAVPFATTLTPDEFNANFRFANCRLLCMDRKFLQRLNPFIPSGTALIFEDSLDWNGEKDWPSPIEPMDDHRDAALMFTSGTTARPRAVRITHQNIQANTKSIIEYLDLTSKDRIMAILPFYYCFGTSLLHTHLRAGGSIVISNTFTYPETVLDMMEATECSGFAGVPSTYQTLLRNSTFPIRQMKCLRKVQQAGGKLQEILIKELVEAVPNAEVFVMYGQTEATARLSYLPPALLETKLGSIGKGIPGVNLKVIGETGEEVAPGEVGEIVAWGENISPGYLDDPEASAKKFIGGALHTTDLATVDEDGFIYVVDRKDDFIKTYGYRVSSQQIEACIVELPEVVTAAVIGEPDLVSGEAIKAFVVLKNGVSLSSTDIVAHCTQRLARHMIPKEIIFLNHLPLNSNGKVMKTELRKIAVDGTN